MLLPPALRRLGHYCISCHAPDVRRVIEDGRTHYLCASCGERAPRSIVVDDAITWWVDAEGRYWHESVGVLLYNDRGEFVTVLRSLFPFAHALPAGHVDKGETPIAAIRREVREELGIDASEGSFTHLATFDMPGDACRRGCDDHRWHLYALRLPSTAIIRTNDEARSWAWMTASRALSEDIAYALRYILTRYAREIGATLHARNDTIG